MITDIYIIRYDKVKNRRFDEKKEQYKTVASKNRVLDFIKGLDSDYEVQKVLSVDVKTKDVTDYKLKLDGFNLTLEGIVKPKRTKRTPVEKEYKSE